MKKGKVLYQDPDITEEEKAEFEAAEKEAAERTKKVLERRARDGKVYMSLSERRIDEDFSPCFQTEDDEG